jgi:hypothetical protein
MLKSQNERTSERSSKARVVQLGGREIVTEGLPSIFGPTSAIAA